MKQETRILYAEFLNEASGIAIDIMSPVWNGNQDKAYSLLIQGVGILERTRMQSNDYISGDPEKEIKFNTYFQDCINDLCKDTRYTDNKRIQDFCDKYEQKLKSILDFILC